MQPSPTNVARRFLARSAAEEAIRTASRVHTAAAHRVREELTVNVLASFAEGIHTAGSFTSRLKQVYEAFQKVPKAWADFKHMLGVKGDGLIALVKELPGKIKHMLQEGQKFLVKLGQKFRELPAVAIYLDVLKATGSVAGHLSKLFEHLPPEVQKVLRGIGSKAKTFAAFLDEVVKQHPALAMGSTVLSAAVFAIIWMNVYELSWDVPEIVRGFLGGYSWVELLHTLPESALGFLLSLVFPGIPTKLMLKAAIPATFVLRLAWLQHKGLLEHRPGKGFRVKWEVMGGQPAEAPTTISV